MEAEPPLLQELAKMVGIIATLTIALGVAVKANPRAAELRACFDGVRQAARAKLGKFEGQPGLDGIEISIRDFDRMLRGGVDFEGVAEVPPDPIEGVGWMVGIIHALEAALEITVARNPLAFVLRSRVEDIREVATARVIGEDVLDNVFDGIDYAMDELEAMLPAESTEG